MVALTNGVHTTSERTGQMSSEDDHRHDGGGHDGESRADARDDFVVERGSSTVSTAVWISAGGALVLLISVFLTGTASATIKIATVSQSSARARVDGTRRGGEGRRCLALILAAWVIDLFVPTSISRSRPGRSPAARVRFDPVRALQGCIQAGRKRLDRCSRDSRIGGHGIRHLVALLAAIAVVVGAWLHMTETQR
jgi:hypothetical protein